MKITGQPGHRATTAHVQAAYPFVAEGGLGGRGAYIGWDVYGGSFCYDPWELYGRELTSPNAVVIGIVGRAKSSLVKTYVFRQSVFGRQAWIVDVKGEYERLAHALGVEPIALSPGGAVRLNPLTPRGGRERQLNLLYSVAAAALERPLSPEEKRAGQEALDVLDRRAAGEPTLPAVVDVLLHPPAEMAEALAMDAEEIAVCVRPMAFALDQLCTGNLRGMFDGPTTPGLDLDAPLVVLNLRAVLNTHTSALGILMTCATAWLQAMIEAETDGDSAKRIVVVDEGWRILSSLGIGEWLQQSFKLSRALGVQNIVVLHRLSDLRAAGAEGSRELRLAEGLLADAETKVCYAQPPDQLPQARELLGLTDTEAELLPHLRRGWALWKVGQRSFLVQHRLSSRRARDRRHRRADARRSRGMNGDATPVPSSASDGAGAHPLETLALRLLAGLAVAAALLWLTGELSGRILRRRLAVGGRLESRPDRPQVPTPSRRSRTGMARASARTRARPGRVLRDAGDASASRPRRCRVVLGPSEQPRRYSPQRAVGAL